MNKDIINIFFVHHCAQFILILIYFLNVARKGRARKF